MLTRVPDDAERARNACPPGLVDLPDPTTTERSFATSLLHTPITFRDVEFRNRAWISPMCQYSSRDGVPTDWHLVHLGARATGGAGAVIVEASAVVARGPHQPGRLGHLVGRRRSRPSAAITAFLSEHGAVPGIQIAHAGRKASIAAPWRGGAPLGPDERGWQPVAPSAAGLRRRLARAARARARARLADVVEAFAAAARRAHAAGFRLLEVHAAHGYLLHEFLSPLSNRRSDALRRRLRRAHAAAARGRRGGARRVARRAAARRVRISASDWVEGGWSLDDSVALAKLLGPLGVDLVDCSSGGISPAQQIPLGPGYQVPFAAAIRRRRRHRDRRPSA